MKTNIFIVLFSLISLYGYNQNYRDERHISWIKFQWEGDSIGNRYFDKLAMLVPFQIESIPYKFTSQFDLGAPVTMIYGNSFKPLLNKFPEITEKLDTVNKKYVIQGIKVGGFSNISFYLDTVKFDHQNLAFFEGFGEKYSKDNFKKDTILHIGTIGSNLFKNKVLIIDFKNQKIAVLDSIPYKAEKGLTDIIIEKGRIKVPVTIDGKKVYVLYDTGSGFATLYLSTNNWNNYRDSVATPDTIMATAWGIEYPLLISKTDIEIKIGNSLFKPETVVANSLEPYYNFFKKENIIGLMGNKLFYDKTLIIDFRNKKFGIIDNHQLINTLRFME